MGIRELLLSRKRVVIAVMTYTFARVGAVVVLTIEDYMWRMKVMSKVEQLSQVILRDLLADFAGHNLTANDLTNGYGGVTLAALKPRCCGQTSASSVDFDLALKDLEESELIQTGPMVAIENPPNSPLVFIGVRSKYEYVYLTEKGYKAAQKTQPEKSPSRTSPAPQVHISGGHFHQSPIGIGSHIAQVLTGTLGDAPVFVDLRNAVEESGIETSAKAQLLAGIEEMQRTQNTPGFTDRYKDFIALAANYMTIISPFLPALSDLLSGSHS